MFCIGIALVFWLLVKLSGEYFLEKQVNISYQLPQDKAFSKKPPSDIVARVEGTGWDLLFSYFTSPEINLFYKFK